MEQETFPSGVKIDDWFYETDIPKLEDLGKTYVITEYGIQADGKIYTEEFQKLIDRIAENGGGVLVVPAGTFRTGALFFRQGVDLYLEKEAILKGSDDITDYPVLNTRIEGQSCLYFSALINVDGFDGFTLAGEGTIDGNGWKAWKSFWLRRSWNPDCTNKDEQRARLLYISNSQNVTIAGVTLQNSMFWSSHIYQSHHVKYLNVRILSPGEPINAPSTDAIDLDAARDVLIKGCYMAVNDDAVCMKGGKGVDAENLPENGPTERVLVEDCEFGFTHSCITCGSECLHAKDIYVRCCKSGVAHNFFRLKMRPDTRQIYEDILVEDCESHAGNFVNINPWTQFNVLGKDEILLSYARNITFRNCHGTSLETYSVKEDPGQYILSEIRYEDIQITEKDPALQDLEKNKIL